jgi:hypothetical protein
MILHKYGLRFGLKLSSRFFKIQLLKLSVRKVNNLSWRFSLIFVLMDHDIELRFQKLKTHLEKDFGGGMDVQALLFLIGVNELGIGYKNFTKQEKTDLLHVAVCTLLEPYGYYEFVGKDDDEWPHFKLLKELPPLTHNDQQHLIKEAMIDYFVANDYYVEEDKV